MSTKKGKPCCDKCLSTDSWMKGECFNGDCPCHQSESIDLDEIDNKITDLIQRLPFEKRGEIWTLIHESRKQAITTAVAKRELDIAEELRDLPGRTVSIGRVLQIIQS